MSGAVYTVARVVSDGRTDTECLHIRNTRFGSVTVAWTKFVTPTKRGPMELFTLIPLAVAVGLLSGLSLRSLYS
jgi:hypothetical protein